MGNFSTPNLLNQPASPRMLRSASPVKGTLPATITQPLNSLNLPAEPRTLSMTPDADALGLLPSAPISLPAPGPPQPHSLGPNTGNHSSQYSGHNSSNPSGQHNKQDHSDQNEGHQLHSRKSRNGQQPPPQLQQFHRKSIGDWDFVRTIGAGSMGKVKLARHNESGEKCAVKIVPRAAKLYQRTHANDPPAKSSEEAAQRQKEFDKEIARDKRTVREGALGRLLFHPHICRLYEIVPLTNHYYMLFEYVEGGQLLDYIVSHGSLNEKYARKFAREIASALDYCHKNNVVHRDLKIENIMINQKGEIKIIDFGLSNLYMPHHLLKTYCGSLYFAAPELLSAKPYVGPEVDVWSFGVVLYVLVCGKVPFDDPVVSALHEKIKKGNVEYPSFLSKGCTSLLSRMLVVDPTKRATLAEVLQHPWMNQSYDHVAPSYIPDRVPLLLPLDQDIIKTISLFDLGSVSFITEELTKVITSPDYQLSCDNWYKYVQRGQKPPSDSNVVYGFHSLVSIYYLVDEVRRRKRTKDEAIKKHLQDPAIARPEPPNVVILPVSALSSGAIRLNSYRPNNENLQPPTIAPPSSFCATAIQTPQRSHSISASYSRPKPDSRPDTLATTPSRVPRHKEQTPTKLLSKVSHLSYPEPVHTPTMLHTLEVDSSPNFDGHLKNNNTQSPIALQQIPETLDPNGGITLGFSSLLSKLSTKKLRSPVSKASSAIKEGILPPLFPLPKKDCAPSSPESSSSSFSSKRDPLVRRGVSMKITAKEKSSGSRVNLNNELMIKHERESYDEEYSSHAHSPSATGKPHNFIPIEYLPPLPTIDPKQMEGSIQFVLTKAPDTTSHMGFKKFHPTARAKSVGSHVLKNLPGKAPSGKILPNVMAAQNSDDGIDGNMGENGDNSRYDDVVLGGAYPVELPTLSDEKIIEQFERAPRNSMPSIEYPKTLFLKGFFSVQTTSTKPLPVIRYNIIRVLSRLGVRFQEVKGGLVCVQSVYTPTRELEGGDDANYAHGIIDDYKLDDHSDDSKAATNENKFSSESESYTPEFDPRPAYSEHQSHQSRRSSETGNSRPFDNKSERSENRAEQSRSESIRPSLHVVTSPPSTYVKGHRSSNSTSATGHRRKFSVGQTFLQNYRKKNGSQTLMPPNTPATARLTKLLLGAMDLDNEDLDDETRMQLHQLADDDSVDSLSGIMIGGGSDMLVSSRIEQRAKYHRVNQGSEEDGLLLKKTPLKFEINIVKVPLVGLYGVQFKKTLGNTWNYKTLAGRILKDLNL